MTQGLSKKEKELRDSKCGLAWAGNLIAYGEAPSIMESHDFSKDLDNNSLKGGKRIEKKSKLVNTLKDSVMSAGITTLGNNEEDKEMVSIEDNDFGNKSIFSKSMEESKVGEVK